MATGNRVGPMVNRGQKIGGRVAEKNGRLRRSLRYLAISPALDAPFNTRHRKKDLAYTDTSISSLLASK